MKTLPLVVSKSLDGPWDFLGAIQVATNEFSKLGRMSNVSVVLRPDGDFMIVARSGAIWISKSGILGPYTVLGPGVYSTVPEMRSMRTLEDPVVWYSGGLYHIVVNDWNPRKAYHLTSPDGIGNWTFRGLAYDPTRDFLRHTDGTVNRWDGSAYLYWGSGWNWVNGACFAAKLNKDLSGFDGEAKIVTPEHYFEGPTMLKHAGRYYLTYSNGKTVSDTYEVRYAIGDHPLGPFKEGATSPILVTDRARQVVSPGHHGFFHQAGRDFIVYLRLRVPFVEDSAFHQVCIDELRFTADRWIEKVVPTHRGPALVQGRTSGRDNLAGPGRGASATASSSSSKLTLPERVLDDNYATRWAPNPEEVGSWIQLDLGAERSLHRSELRFEYAWKTYSFLLEASLDGNAWQASADHRAKPATGSPLAILHPSTARYLRITFPETTQGRDLAVLEWAVF